MKRITILATGSRGDVQPFVALGYGLRQAGQQVCFVSNAQFEAWVRAYGLDFRPVDWDAQASLQSEHGQGMTAGDPLATLRYLRQETPRIYARVQADSWAACQDAECLLYSLLSPWGYDIVEKLGLPAVAGALHPLTPTRSFATQLLPFDLGGPLNLATHYLAEQLLWQIMRKPVNRFRQAALGLAPLRFPDTPFSRLRQQRTPLLVALSPSVIARPPDWPAYVHMAGYWFLPSPPGWGPSPALLAFIHGGPPPVYIGFGSMSNRDAPQTTRLVIEALRLCGQRGVLAGGWGGLRAADLSAAELPPEVFFLDEAPHEWLFARMAAEVHHGGAGTTAAGLRAGVPSIVVPHMQDQPYWGRRLQALGVGPAPIPRRALTAQKLAESIQLALQDQEMQARAARLGRQIRAEAGLARAVEVIEAAFA